MDPSTWGLHSNGFNSCVTAWNIGVRKILRLPYTTHTWMLGPLTNSVHMKYKLYIRDIKIFNQGFLNVIMFWFVHVFLSSVIMQILFLVIN